MVHPSEVGEEDLAKSFVRVRQAIGWVGICLPPALLVLAAFERFLPPTISDSYYHYGRDLFVGTLVALGLFLVSYTGHAPKGRERFSDRRLSTATGFMALGVAFVPTGAPSGATLPFVHGWVGAGAGGLLHLGFAALFFIGLATFCLVQFRLGVVDGDVKRAYCQRVYAACGWVLVAVILLIVAAFAVRVATGTRFVDDARVIFILESIGVVAFGIAWLVKGDGMRRAVQRLANRSAPARQRAEEGGQPGDFVFRKLAFKRQPRRRRPVPAQT